MAIIVAVCASPTGMALTYMAAEALQKAAELKGWAVYVETQGAMGIENELPLDSIAQADIVLLTDDMGIQNEQRFHRKTIVRVSASDMVKRANTIMNRIERRNKSRKRE